MKAKDILSKKLSVVLKSTKKETMLDELIVLFRDNNIVKDTQAIKEQFLAREALMSTGIGLTIGVPHVRTEYVSLPVIAVGLAKEGIEDYTSLDGQPVKIIFMIMVKTGAHRLYITLLSQIASVVRDEQFRAALLEEETAEGIYAKLCEGFSGIT